MKALVAAAAISAASLLVACSGTTTPLPGGLPPEYEPPRPFPSGTPGAPGAAPSAGPEAPTAAPSAAPAAPK
jgi:hypothetical protein